MIGQRLLRCEVVEKLGQGGSNSRRLHDAGVRPVPAASQPRRIGLRRCPMGSNAQVPRQLGTSSSYSEPISDIPVSMSESTRLGIKAECV